MWFNVGRGLPGPSHGAYCSHEMHSLSDLPQSGLITLGTILIMSLLAMFVLVERLLGTAGIQESVRQQMDTLIKLLYQGEIDDARKHSQQKTTPAMPMFAVALQRTLQNRQGAEVALERERQQFNQWLRQRLWMLGTIAAAAPFVGLFGTVVGIMQSFRDIAETGGGGFAVVSRGLSEALITTAAGIIVAVEAVVFYNYLQARLARIAFSVRLAGEEFMEVLADRSRWAKGKDGDLQSTGS